MIVYNITTKVHTSVNDAWLQWQLEENIPAIMSAGFFMSYKVLRLLEQDDSDGYTYAVQYKAPSMEAYQQYSNMHATVQQQAEKKWGGKTISFPTVMEVIQ